jgi:hypothetical protein
MIDAGEIARHACSAVQRSTLETEPFRHLVIEQLLPPPMHRSLVAALPPTEQYERPEYGLGAGERAILTTAASSASAALRSVLVPVQTAICSTEFIAALLARLGIEPARHRPDESPGVQVFLARDVPPYAIGPHTDVPERLASGVLYLAPVDAPPEWGTTLFVPADTRFSCTEGRHYGFDGFLSARTVPFAPNRAVVFRRTDRSFHGLRLLTPERRVRDVLLFEIVRAGVIRTRAVP